MEVEISCLGACDSQNILISQQTLFFFPRKIKSPASKTEAEEFEGEESMLESEPFNKNNSPNPFDSNQL